MKNQGKLSPHQFIEFDLMLKGEKDVAFFFGDLQSPDIDKRFSMLKDNNLIKKLDIDSDYPIHIFYLSDKKWKAQFLLHMVEVTLINKEKILLKEIETIFGTLLGYSPEDIQTYLEHHQLI